MLSLVISGNMSSLENLHRFIALGSGIGVPHPGSGFIYVCAFYLRQVALQGNLPLKFPLFPTLTKYLRVNEVGKHLQSFNYSRTGTARQVCID